MQVLQKCPLCGQYSIIKIYDKKNITKEMAKYKDFKHITAQFKEVTSLYEKLNDFNDCMSKMSKNPKIQIEIKKSEKRIFQSLNKFLQKCDYCSETKMATYMEDSTLRNLGQQLYDEFYIVATNNGKPLPQKIKIEVINVDFGHMGSCSYHKDIKMWVIEINALASIDKHGAKVIFAHEFGHLLHDYDENTGGEKPRSLWNSEYYAAEVEIQKLLKFSSININGEIRVTDKLLDNRRIITLTDYLFDLHKGIINQTKEQCDDGLNDASVVSILRFAIWYRSKINFIKKYLEKSSTKFIPDVNAIEKYIEQRCGVDDEELCKLLKCLDNNITGSYMDIDSNLLSETVNKIHWQLLSHIPGREHFRSLEIFSKHTLDDIKNKLDKAEVERKQFAFEMNFEINKETI